MIDDTLYRIMRIQCLYIQLTKYSDIVPKEIIATLDLVLKLLESEVKKLKKKKT